MFLGGHIFDMSKFVSAGVVECHPVTISTILLRIRTAGCRDKDFYHMTSRQGVK